MGIRIRLSKAVLLLLCGVGTGRAGAQIGIYGMGMGAHLSGFNVTGATSVYTQTGFTAVGGAGGLYWDFANIGPYLKLGLDTRLFHGSSSSTAIATPLTLGTGGLRVVARIPHTGIRPYGQLEIGGVSSTFGSGNPSSSAFAFQVQMGADVKIIPHLDLRGEYGIGKTDTILSVGAVARETLQTFGGGLVLRLP